MIENVKRVSNPLTIVAIFAALAEVAAAIALATLDPGLQEIFVWFVMGFPVLLVILFFATLNFNPTVLYAPGDFQNEANFLSTVVGSRTVSSNIDEVTRAFESMRETLLAAASQEAVRVGERQSAELAARLEREFSRIEAKLRTASEAAEEVASHVSEVAFPQSALQAQILGILANSSGSLSASQVAQEVGMSRQSVYRALHRLLERGLITRQGDGAVIAYNASAQGSDKHAL